MHASDTTRGESMGPRPTIQWQCVGPSVSRREHDYVRTSPGSSLRERRRGHESGTGSSETGRLSLSLPPFVFGAGRLSLSLPSLSRLLVAGGVGDRGSVATYVFGYVP